MKARMTTVGVLSLALAGSAPTIESRWLIAQAQPSAATSGLTIETLIDIRHPSNPVWSRDSRRVAFMWERAGVANLYVVAADGKSKPIPITSDGAPVAGVFWSADSQTLYFMRQGTLMQAAPDGRQTPRAVWSELPGRSLAVSRDGTRVAYVVGGGPGQGGRGGGRGRGGASAAAGSAGATAQAPAGPAEIRVRSLADGREQTIAVPTGAPNALTWIDGDRHLTYTIGGGGETIRHEQTPDYSGAKIIYTITERAPGAPGETFIVPSAGGTPSKVATAAGGGRGARWIDATRVVFDRQSPDYKRRGIYVARVNDAAEPTLIHEDVKATFWSMTGGASGGAQPSPDGKWIAFLSDRDGWDHLYVAPSTGGAPVQITKGTFEAWRPSWSPDSTRVAFDSNEGPNPGSRHLGVAMLNGDLSKARVTMITKGRGTDTDPQWSPDGRLLLYQHTDPQNSADLFVVDATAASPTPIRLTDSLPAGVNRAALVEPELVHYPGPDGKPVPAYLFVPKNLDRTRKHPAIVWIHGDGVNQNYDGWHIQRNYAVYYSFHQYLLQKGYIVLAPDYRGSIGYGSAWREGVYMDVGGKDFKDAALSAAYLKTLSYVDTDRVGVWGLSYGGFFTLLAVTEMPTTFRAAVDVAGVADYAMYYEDPYHGGWTVSRIGTPDQHPDVYAQASPISHVDRLARPLLVLHGTADVNVPYLHSVRLLDALLKERKGPLVEFMTYPGEFHYFTREHVLRDAWTRVEAFFDKHLRSGATAPTSMSRQP